MTIKKFAVFVIALTSTVMFSCDRYQKESVDREYIQTLADSLSSMQKNNVTWANSPEEIVRYFFPPVSHDAGPKLYEIKTKLVSSTRLNVELTEEGPIDDEVSGERRTLYFQSENGVWRIVGLKFETLRRY